MPTRPLSCELRQLGKDAGRIGVENVGAVRLNQQPGNVGAVVRIAASVQSFVDDQHQLPLPSLAWLGWPGWPAFRPSRPLQGQLLRPKSHSPPWGLNRRTGLIDGCAWQVIAIGIPAAPPTDMNATASGERESSFDPHRSHATGRRSVIRRVQPAPTFCRGCGTCSAKGSRRS